MKEHQKPLIIAALIVLFLCNAVLLFLQLQGNREIKAKNEQAAVHLAKADSADKKAGQLVDKLAGVTDSGKINDDFADFIDEKDSTLVPPQKVDTFNIALDVLRDSVKKVNRRYELLAVAKFRSDMRLDSFKRSRNVLVVRLAPEKTKDQQQQQGDLIITPYRAKRNPKSPLSPYRYYARITTSNPDILFNDSLAYYTYEQTNDQLSYLAFQLRASHTLLSETGQNTSLGAGIELKRGKVAANAASLFSAEKLFRQGRFTPSLVFGIRYDFIQKHFK